MRRLLPAWFAVAWVAGVAAGQPEVLVDRTVAVVAGRAITLADARAAVALGLVDAPDGADAARVGATLLVDRELVLREVQRYAPAEPDTAEVDARVAEVTRRLGDAAVERIFAATGFSAARLRSWVRDDLRLQAYLAQRFAAAGAAGDPEAAARRRDLVAEWVADLRRRTPLVVLP